MSTTCVLDWSLATLQRKKDELGDGCRTAIDIVLLGTNVLVGQCSKRLVPGLLQAVRRDGAALPQPSGQDADADESQVRCVVMNELLRTYTDTAWHIVSVSFG